MATADRLELLSSSQPGQATKYSSLLGVLNKCFTKVGTRTLRSAILQPLYDVQLIEERLNCVTELVNNREMALSLQVYILLSISTRYELFCFVASLAKGSEHRSVIIDRINYTGRRAKSLKSTPELYSTIKHNCRYSESFERNIKQGKGTFFSEHCAVPV